MAQLCAPTVFLSLPSYVPCPSLEPPPQTLWSLISCAAYSHLCPSHTMCPLLGFCGSSQVWNLCLDCITSSRITSPLPSSTPM